MFPTVAKQRICVISRTKSNLFGYLTAALLPAEGLEFVVDSQLVGVEKPDPRIFDIALSKLALSAARTVYVGDIRSVDEAGARAAGMHFVLIDPFGDYAAPGQAAVRRLEDLPALLASRFHLPPTRSLPS